MTSAYARTWSRVTGYADEIAFAARIAKTPLGFVSLAHRTLRFHLHNGGLLRDAPSREITCRIGIEGVARTVTLRTGPVGDLFILYEVLQKDPYFIPHSMLDPATVRTIVDCGANIGITALQLAARYPRAMIYCVEPHPANFALLVRNTAQEKRIMPIQACVVGEAGQEVRITTDRPAWGNTTVTDGSGVEVPSVTIGELRERFSLGVIDLLKVDIEGAERNVFARASFMQFVRLAILELHQGYGIDNLERDLAPWGYQAHAPDASLGTKLVTAQRRTVGSGG